MILAVLVVPLVAVLDLVPVEASSPGEDALTSGTYAVVVDDGGVTYTSKWVLTVTDGHVTGLSYWSCCPDGRTDPLTGSTGGGRVTITRDCSGQGQSTCESQTYIGTITAPGQVKGTWSGDGESASGPNTWAMTRAPPQGTISGNVYHLECNMTDCTHQPPLGAITVEATSGANSASTITDDRGNYTLSDLSTGIWTVAPKVYSSRISEPTSRSVSITGQVQSASGVDFQICDTHPLPNVPDACVPVYDYSEPSHFQVTGPYNQAYVDPEHWPVDFTVQAGACDRSADYTWYVDGTQVNASPSGNGCTFQVEFDKLGTYRVAVEELQKQLTNERTTYVAQVAVQNFLIASVGDSLASGEGLENYSGNIICDDSTLAYPVKVAEEIKDSDPRSSVTFIQLACSGATLDPANARSVLGAAAAPESILDQLKDLEYLIKDRKVDALLIDGGINDVGFVSFILQCVLQVRCQGSSVGKDLPEAIDRVNPAMSLVFDELHYGFADDQLAYRDIYWLAYPDPFHNETGQLCPVMIENPVASSLDKVERGFENINGEDEVTWWETHFMDTLTHLIGGYLHSVNYIVPTGFLTHGYCSTSSWFTHISDVKEGRSNYSGIFHPNSAGEEYLYQLMLGKVKPALLPEGQIAS